MQTQHEHLQQHQELLQMQQHPTWEQEMVDLLELVKNPAFS
jgi:hypothetical protein